VTKTEKAKVIEYLTEEFSSASGIVVCDYKGMTVSEIESVRNVARQHEIRVKVVKNTLAMIALKKSGLECLDLTETNIVLWAKDQVSLAKMVVDFAKKHEENFKLKLGFMDGVLSTSVQIEGISKLPSKDELVAMLLSTWTAPVRNMASVLQAPLRNMVNVLDNIGKNKSG
jgi:large subunit ribosomal protein L10